jgi:hypothetical protein
MKSEKKGDTSIFTNRQFFDEKPVRARLYVLKFCSEREEAFYNQVDIGGQNNPDAKNYCSLNWWRWRKGLRYNAL